MRGGVYLPGKPATLYVKTLKLPLVVALVWRTGEERAGVRKRARLTQRNKDCMTRDERDDRTTQQGDKDPQTQTEPFYIVDDCILSSDDGSGVLSFLCPVPLTTLHGNVRSDWYLRITSWSKVA